MPSLHGVFQFVAAMFCSKAGQLCLLPEGSNVDWPQGIRTLQCEKVHGGHWFLGVNHWDKVPKHEFARVRGHTLQRTCVLTLSFAAGLESSQDGNVAAAVESALIRSFGVQVGRSSSSADGVVEVVEGQEFSQKNIDDEIGVCLCSSLRVDKEPTSQVLPMAHHGS